MVKAKLIDLIHRIFGRSDIYIGERLYMRRWRFLNVKYFGIRLHNICLPDLDREMHDHPFSFVSIILSGGYTEHVPISQLLKRRSIQRGDVKTIEYRRWSINVRRAEDIHRLDPVLPNTWTLVFRGRIRRPWGFLTPDRGWIHWKKFVVERDGRGGAAGPYAAKSSI